MKKLDTSKLKKILQKPVVELPKEPIAARSDSWPSREPINETSNKEPIEQLNIRGPRNIIQRFKEKQKYPRQPYYDVLETIMDRADGNN